LCATSRAPTCIADEKPRVCAQDVDDNSACACGRLLEADNTLCWTCNSRPVAEVELEIDNACKDRSFTRSITQAQKAPVFVDDRDFDFTGCDEREDAQSTFADDEPAAATSSSASPAKRGSKRKAEAAALADLLPPKAKPLKKEAGATAASASRAAAAKSTAVAAQKRSKKSHLTAFSS
jgi:hypothetical protein